LTSYVHVENDGRIAADRFHVISALNWNADKKITSVETVDLVKLSSDIFKDVLEYLKTKGLADGIKFDDKTNNKGMIIGQLSGINSNRGFVDIYSGDPSQLVNVQKIATTGNEIGSITYYGGNTVTLQNGVVVQPVNYNRTDQCGTEIFTFNGTSIKNNLSVTQKKNVGDVIANINGTNTTYAKVHPKVSVTINAHSLTTTASNVYFFFCNSFKSMKQTLQVALTTNK